MSQNKKIIIGILIVLVIIIGLLITYKVIKKDVTNENITPNSIENENNGKNDINNMENTDNMDKEVVWEEITENGVDEELLLQNINAKLVIEITSELQTLIAEVKEENGNSEITAEEWERIFADERYRNVLSMGNSAIKPLYMILSNSIDEGEYEYLCAKILCELSGFDFEWTNSQEFLDTFNQKILENQAE